MRNDVIDVNDNGLIEETKIKKINKFMLWSYIYYLWMHNHKTVSGNVFSKVTSYRFKKHFTTMLTVYCKEILNVEMGNHFRKSGDLYRVSKGELLSFVNDLVAKQSDRLYIPFMNNTELENDELRRLDLALEHQLLLEDELITSLSKFIDTPPRIAIVSTLETDGVMINGAPLIELRTQLKNAET